jgi:hypothetical protein
MRIWLVALLTAFALGACGGDDECKPLCDGVTCGDDGCGGSCGECGDGTICLEGGCLACDAKANCLGRQCGPDGCGGSCGACSSEQVCDWQSQLCMDKPDNCESACAPFGLECGPDGCGGDCGECPLDTLCTQGTYLCQGKCDPVCEGLECGPDGCGGLCGQCESGEICDAGVCLLDSRLPEDDFRVMWGYQGRIPGVNDNEHDLFMVNPDRSNPLVPGEIGPQALTGFSLKNATDCQLIMAEDGEGNVTEYGPCSCNFGCVVDRALKWIAVSIKKPGGDGFTFQLGRFDAQLNVAMVKGIFLKEIIDFKFAGNYLYYTRQHYCDGAHCQYQFYRVQLEPVGQTEELFIFPPESDPDWPNHSNYKGHFKVSQDGQVLVILGTTIRSTRIYMWKAGNLHELDYICNSIVNGECIGAGSEYTDTDPVAISPDNSKIAAFTVAERDLRLRLYDTNTLEQKYLNLFSVASGTYFADICKQLLSPVWEFKNVIGDPRFSPDGNSLYFIANNDCAVVSSTSKPHTNLLMMDLGVVGDGTPFAPDDFINITNNPPDSGPDNQLLEAFDISPSGKTIVFTASPRYEFVGPQDEPIMQPLQDDSKRALRDFEVWLIGTTGAGKMQLTDTSTFAAKSPMALDANVTSSFNNP